MADYRVYILDAGNHIIGFEEGAYESDARAVAYVDSMLGQHCGIEVWCGARRVGRFSGGRASRAQAAQGDSSGCPAS